MKAKVFIQIKGAIESKSLYECVKDMGLNVTDLGDTTLVYGDCPDEELSALVSICWSFGDVVIEITQ